MIHSREDQPDAETEHFTKVKIKIDNHKKASDRFLSISDINRLISIDYDRLPSIFIEYRKYRLGTSCLNSEGTFYT